MSDLDGNPADRFSGITAQMLFCLYFHLHFTLSVTPTNQPVFHVRKVFFKMKKDSQNVNNVNQVFSSLVLGTIEKR